MALVSSVLGLLEFAVEISRGRLTVTPGEMGAEAVELTLDGIALFLLFTSPALFARAFPRRQIMGVLALNPA